MKKEFIGEVRKFLEESSVWDMDYIFERKVRMLEQFDKKFNKKKLTTCGCEG